jgi:hypothetical protein
VSSTAGTDLEFFIDRSLGARQLRRALEDLTFVAHSMNERYGAAAGEKVKDEAWIEDAGKNGFLILTKDDVRQIESQVASMENARAKVFWLTNAGLKGDVQVQWYLNNLNGIIARGTKPGPFMYGVYEHRLQPLPLRPAPKVEPGEQGQLV